jgi:glycosyltransferase involved in cell wall biosynthesis
VTRISVVIATKDRAEYLHRTLVSLEAQAGAPRFEIVVVDNGSTDTTAAVVEQRRTRAPFTVNYVTEPQPNRAKARNRGVEAATGEYLLFCDDDVQAPSGWIAAHAAAHGGTHEYVVNGPILNVPSYERRPRPSVANYSRAFLCTCNVSVSKRAFVSVGGFDEAFELYGWEDTELGLRLRRSGTRWRFAWDAYLWHIKLPAQNTLEDESRKAVEKARMARRFLAKHPSNRARLATGAYPLNELRGRYLLPEWLLALYAGLAGTQAAPGWIKAIARAQFLDGIYTRELVRSRDAQEPAHG